jgi:hypothetical protein
MNININVIPKFVDNQPFYNKSLGNQPKYSLYSTPTVLLKRNEQLLHRNQLDFPFNNLRNSNFLSQSAVVTFQDRENMYINPLIRINTPKVPTRINFGIDASTLNKYSYR